MTLYFSWFQAPVIELLMNGELRFSEKLNVKMVLPPRVFTKVE